MEVGRICSTELETSPRKKEKITPRTVIFQPVPPHLIRGIPRHRRQTRPRFLLNHPLKRRRAKHPPDELGNCNLQLDIPVQQAVIGTDRGLGCRIRRADVHVPACKGEEAPEPGVDGFLAAGLEDYFCNGNVVLEDKVVLHLEYSPQVFGLHGSVAHVCDEGSVRGELGMCEVGEGGDILTEDVRGRCESDGSAAGDG